MNIALFLNPALLDAALLSRANQPQFRGRSWKVVWLLPESGTDPMPPYGSDGIPSRDQDLVVSAKPANNVVERSLSALSAFAEIEKRIGPIGKLAVFGHDGPFRRFTTAALVLGIEILEGAICGIPIDRPPALA